MNFVQITPGAGGMYCGNCFRDNALVAELRRLGHPVLMVPLYLPLRLDEADQSAGTPIFFSGVNVYLEQESPWFRRAPAWLHRLLASPAILRWAAGRAAKTRAADVGDLTLSMLRGEDGNQAREIEELLAWLGTQPKPDLVCLSNALLIGMGRRLRTGLGTRLACMLQGEDAFLDALPEAQRDAAWRTMAERLAEADILIAPSRYYAELMASRLGLPGARFQVVPNGISLDGFTARTPAASQRGPARPLPAPLPAAAAADKGHRSPRDAAVPAVGYFARMCREKGLDTLVEAFVLLKQRRRVPGLKLRVGGGCGPADEPFVNRLKQRLAAVGLAAEAEFHPNLSREDKLRLLESLTVFSVPALYGEAFGLYVIEALACGVPVVQPRTAAFPELLDATHGGLLCEPGSAPALADALEALLLDPATAAALGAAGRAAVERDFTARAMAERILAACGTDAAR